MKKILLLALSLFAISSCSSTYYAYQNKEEIKNISLKTNKINIRNFDLQLFESRLGGRISANGINSDFLNTKEMKKLMLDTINKSLIENNYNGNSNSSYQYDVKIIASRAFSAFSSNKYAGLNIEDIKIDVYQNDNFVAKKYLQGSKSSIIQTRPAINCGSNRGFMGNLKTIAKTIAHIKGVQDEMEDVQRCAQSIYGSIINLGN
jgi:hypothetical protein